MSDSAPDTTRGRDEPHDPNGPDQVIAIMARLLGDIRGEIIAELKAIRADIAASRAEIAELHARMDRYDGAAE